MDEEWKKEWQPMIKAIGKDFSDKGVKWGADEVEKGSIRRFLEPLEFDCPLHYDQEVAKKFGYDDIIAPCSSLLTWLIPPYWVPGQTVFNSNERNAQPIYSPVTDIKTNLMPEVSEYFVTDIEIDYIAPIVVGDKLCRAGYRLLSCDPKETSVGKGAFMVWESEIRNQNNKSIAKLRTGTYSYNPHSSHSN